MMLLKAILKHKMLLHPSNWIMLRWAVENRRRVFSSAQNTQPPSSFQVTVKPVDNPHIQEALNWLKRAQDANTDAGVSAFYNAYYHPFRPKEHGWSSSYPETTGYIIPTFFDYYHETGDQDLFERAVRMATWETKVQLSSGAIQAGTLDSGRSPAIFNTGQTILGWVRAYRETGEHGFLKSAGGAGQFIVNSMDSDGAFRKHLSPLTAPGPKVYNTRTAWALLELAMASDRAEFCEAAIANVDWALKQQHSNGWFPLNDLGDPTRPLTHTIAYAMRGILEVGLSLKREAYVRQVLKPARAIAKLVPDSGALSGRLSRNWTPEVSWSCLTGNCQLAIIFLKLHLEVKDNALLDAALRLIRFTERNQSLDHNLPGIRGGIQGSFPIDGSYLPYMFSNWASKFFLDALLWEHRILQK